MVKWLGGITKVPYFMLCKGILCCSSFLFADSFQILLNNPTPEWMSQQIHKSLLPFDQELSKSFLDALFDESGKHFALMRVRYQEGVLSFQSSIDHEIMNEWQKIFRRLDSLHRLPSRNFDFLISCHDSLCCPSCCDVKVSNGVHIHSRNDDVALDFDHLPIFIQTDCSHSRNIIFPDFLYLGTVPLGEKMTLIHRKTWNRKRPTVFFRGSDSGIYDVSMWRSCPRPALVTLSLQNPDFINARFSLVLHHKEWENFALSQGMIGDYIPLIKHHHYKYLIDVDGNCASNPRNQLIMFSESVIFKVNSDSKSWYYPCIRPYEHFIPIREDLSDLISQLEWAKTHDQECRAIASNAFELAKQLFTHDTIDLYIYRLLEAYSEKQLGYYQ